MPLTLDLDNAITAIKYLAIATVMVGGTFAMVGNLTAGIAVLVGGTFAMVLVFIIAMALIPAKPKDKEVEELRRRAKAMRRKGFGIMQSVDSSRT